MSWYHKQHQIRLQERLECYDCHQRVHPSRMVNYLDNGHIRVICHLPCYMKRIGYWRDPPRLIDMIDPMFNEENDDGE